MSANCFSIWGWTSSPDLLPGLIAPGLHWRTSVPRPPQGKISGGVTDHHLFPNSVSFNECIISFCHLLLYHMPHKCIMVASVKRFTWTISPLSLFSYSLCLSSLSMYISRVTRTTGILKVFCPQLWLSQLIGDRAPIGRVQGHSLDKEELSDYRRMSDISVIILNHKNAFIIESRLIISTYIVTSLPRLFCIQYPQLRTSAEAHQYQRL